MGKIFAATIGLTLAFAAAGSECLVFTPKTSFKDADAVYVGVVVAVDRRGDGHPDTITFRVERGFKNAKVGALIAQKAYVSLLWPVSVGQRVLIFSSDILSQCSNAGPLEPVQGGHPDLTERVERTKALLQVVERRAWWWRSPLSSLVP